MSIFFAQRNDAQLALVAFMLPAASIEAALKTATLKKNGLSYTGVPLPGGKGQKNRAKQIAMRLLREHAAILGESDFIEIPVATRGGRGGRPPT